MSPRCSNVSISQVNGSKVQPFLSWAGLCQKMQLFTLIIGQVNGSKVSGLLLLKTI
jgi:hypothetical protein